MPIHNPAEVDGDPGEGHITIGAWNYNTIVQGTWGFIVQAAMYGGFYWRNTPPANADEITYQVYLAAGTYTLRLIGGKNSNAGILDIYLDAVEVASFDQYVAVPVYNQVFTQAGIVVASSKLYTLTCKVDGRNGASSNFYVYLGIIALWRTA